MKKIFKKGIFTLLVLSIILCGMGLEKTALAYGNFQIMGCSEFKGKNYQKNAGGRTITLNGSTIEVYTADYGSSSVVNVYLDDMHIGRAYDGSSPRMYFADIHKEGTTLFRAFGIRNMSTGTHTIKLIADTPSGGNYTDIVRVNVQ
ncbi:hypothetical protein [Hathewaya massiliensis]|uniref:hypothetical protein n=1 Tax=Hathewaya massiliensis TaxID=1964382 RepID=UPI001159D4E8|nr:hypothetical protein [Hathewaya massiliensis]